MNTNNIGLPSLALAQQISDRFINLVDVRKDRFNILSFIVKLSFQSQCILTDDDLARMRLASLIQSKAIDSSPKQEIPQKKKRRKKNKLLKTRRPRQRNPLLKTSPSRKHLLKMLPQLKMPPPRLRNRNPNLLSIIKS